jgi:hypothetical protein
MANLSLTVISGTSSTRVSRDVLDLVEAIIEVERRSTDVLVMLLIFVEEANFVFRSKPNYHEI